MISTEMGISPERMEAIGIVIKEISEVTEGKISVQLRTIMHQLDTVEEKVYAAYIYGHYMQQLKDAGGMKTNSKPL